MTETRALGDILAQSPDDVFTISDNLDYVEAGAGIELLERVNSGTLDRQFAHDPPEVCTRTWHRQREESREEPETLIMQQVTAASPGSVIVNVRLLSKWALSALEASLDYTIRATPSPDERSEMQALAQALKAERDRRKMEAIGADDGN